MNTTLSKATIHAFALIITSLILPVLGFFLGAYIEDTYYEPRWAAIVFATSSFASFLSLLAVHNLAKKYWGFLVFKFFVHPYLAFCLLTIGWVSNNAWYEYDTFSGFVYPSYSVRQDSEFPNHFVFQGPMELGAANLLTQTVLGSKNLDPNLEIVVELQSEGGSPQVGILMAEFIKQYDVKVEVMGHCASACTIAMMGSSKRYVHPRAWIGFHSAYVNSDVSHEERYSYESLKFYNDWLRTRLEEVGADVGFIEKGMVQDSSSGFYPSFNELEASNIVNEYVRTYKSATDRPTYL